MPNLYLQQGGFFRKVTYLIQFYSTQFQRSSSCHIISSNHHLRSHELALKLRVTLYDLSSWQHLCYANKEIAFQNEEKEKRAADLALLTGELHAQQEELRRANDQLHKKTQLLIN